MLSGKHPIYLPKVFISIHRLTLWWRLDFWRKTPWRNSWMHMGSNKSYVPSLKLTARTCQVAPGPKRKRESLPTIHFQVRTVSLREFTANFEELSTFPIFVMVVLGQIFWIATLKAGDCHFMIIKSPDLHKTVSIAVQGEPLRSL